MLNNIQNSMFKEMQNLKEKLDFNMMEKFTHLEDQIGELNNNH